MYFVYVHQQFNETCLGTGHLSIFILITEVKWGN